LKNQSGIATGFTGRAQILEALGRLDEALPFLEKAETIWLDLHNEEGLGLIFDNRARILGKRDQPGEALALYQKEEEILQRLGNKLYLGYCHCNWGLLEPRLGISGRQSRN